MKLSDRLQAIIDFIPLNSIVGDIGTDHGYIPVHLIENKIAKRVIATDISEDSLKKARQLVDRKKMNSLIDIRLGDGLEVIKKFEVDTLIIAGMGGLLVRDILDKDRGKRDTISNLILQANIATGELRRYLYENNFDIIDERLIKEENRFYEIIFARKGKFHVEDDMYYDIGFHLIHNRDPMLREFLEERIKTIENILIELQGHISERSKKRYAELSEESNRLREVLQRIESG